MDNSLFSLYLSIKTTSFVDERDFLWMFLYIIRFCAPGNAILRTTVRQYISVRTPCQTKPPFFGSAPCG